MSHGDDNPLRAEKRKKLHALKEKGINPFPYSFDRNAKISDLVTKYAQKLNTGEKLVDTNYKIAGRLMTLRSMGKAAFFNVQDQTGSLQIYVKLEELPEKERQSFELIDLGDIVGIEGYGLKVVERVPIECGRNPHNESYLTAKADKLGHLLQVPTTGR